MFVDGISSGYQYDYSFLGAKKAEKSQNEFQSSTAIQQTAAPAPLAPTNFVLHGSSPDATEKLVGAWAHNDGVSISIFRPAEFDPEHPTYRAKIWDADGNVTEREIDISQVNPQSSDKVEMFAYASHLSDTGQCPDAQLQFMMAQTTARGQANGESAETISPAEKVDWKAAVEELKERQRQAGNMSSYLACENFLEYLS